MDILVVGQQTVFAKKTFFHIVGIQTVLRPRGSLNVKLNFPLLRIFFPHFEHVNGFTPIWLFTCIVRDSFLEKHFPHVEHEKGFILVWVIRWDAKLCLNVKHLPHKKMASHRNESLNVYPNCFYKQSFCYTTDTQMASRRHGFLNVWLNCPCKESLYHNLGRWLASELCF